MNDLTVLIDALKKYIILSAKDLQNIKQAISVRFHHLSDSERAEMLSRAIHKHLNTHLSGVDVQYRELIRIQLLANTLAKHQYTISRNDIFDSILTLEIEDYLKLNLTDLWSKESVQVTAPKSALETYYWDEIIPKKDFTNYNPQFDSTRIQNSALYDTSNTPKANFATLFDAFYYKVNHFMAKNVIKITCILVILLLFSYSHSIWNVQIEKTPVSIDTSIVNDRYLKLNAFDSFFIKPNSGTSLLNYEKNQPLEYPYFDKITHFYYEPFNYFSVRNYIFKTRNGAIGSPDQFNQIIQKAYTNDIDPLLLLAIIGQEQAFVPIGSTNHEKIINNPYNVFHSWTEFNTNLEDSTQIAINTIENRLKNKPLSASPFKWLNETYADDQNWHRGVRSFYIYLVSIGR